MSDYCSDCLVNWWPYQTRHGRCPTCGGATVNSQEPASVDADTLYYRSPTPQRTSATPTSSEHKPRKTSVQRA